MITDRNEPSITADSLEVAQFIYLLIKNEKIREVIKTVASKVVLILGSFTSERKPILDAIRKPLRSMNYLPVLFDFEGAEDRDLTETVSLLAHLARFVIADITDAKSVPQELMRIVPALPSVPVQPLLQSGDDEYGMFEHFKKFPWVLEIHRYDDAEDLIASLEEKELLATAGCTCGSVPDRRNILHVHDIRNDAQHRAKYPMEAEVNDCRTYVRDFLQKSPHGHLGT